jgi:DNA polymerase-3 subunit delta'
MELIGHQEKWKALSRAVDKGKIPHTLLLSGPPNVGKSTFMLRYVQLLLCPTPVHADGVGYGCGVCRVCGQIERETYLPDYRVYRPLVGQADEKEWVVASEFLDSSVITAELARKVITEAQLRPLNGPRKVLVMLQVDRMNDSAQNALLKTFEEPPPGTFLVLTTDNARKLRETVLSRCWHLQLAAVSEEEIYGWLSARMPEASEAQLYEATRVGMGRPGAAWRELQRLRESEGPAVSRAAIAAEIVARLDRCAPVAALALTEEALQWAKIWWEEDGDKSGETAKGASKAGRAAAVRFLDVLALAVRERWVTDPEGETRAALRLDLMRKTRQYILRNANQNLALDVMFGRMIALRGSRTVASGASGSRR